MKTKPRILVNLSSRMGKAFRQDGFCCRRSFSEGAMKAFVLVQAPANGAGRIGFRSESMAGAVPTGWKPASGGRDEGIRRADKKIPVFS